MNAIDRRSRIWSVIRVSSGNFLEMYDFMVFGYYASSICITVVLAGFLAILFDRAPPSASASSATC